MAERAELIALALEVTAKAPTSMDAVEELESRLGGWSDVPGLEDLLTAVVTYRPGGGERGLLDEAALEFEARRLLHGLDHHGTCSHR